MGRKLPIRCARFFSHSLARLEEDSSFCTLIFHPWVSGQDASRLAVLEDILTSAKDSPKICVKTAGEVALELMDDQYEGRPDSDLYA